MRSIARLGAFVILTLLLAACPPPAGRENGPTPTRAAASPTPEETEAVHTSEPTSARPVEAGGPPLGRYLCYQVPNYEYIGWVELQDGGAYQAGFAQETVQTEGGYSFDADEGRVIWSGGWYEENWPVTYYVEPNVYPGGEERTGTGADRHTLALKVDLENPLLPGQESFANPIYVYCYLGGT